MLFKVSVQSRGKPCPFPFNEGEMLPILYSIIFWSMPHSWPGQLLGSTRLGKALSFLFKNTLWNLFFGFSTKVCFWSFGVGGETPNTHSMVPLGWVVKPRWQIWHGSLGVGGETPSQTRLPRYGLQFCNARILWLLLHHEQDLAT